MLTLSVHLTLTRSFSHLRLGSRLQQSINWLSPPAGVAYLTLAFKVVASPSTYILHISPTLNLAPPQSCIAIRVLNLTLSLASVTVCVLSVHIDHTVSLSSSLLITLFTFYLS